MLRLPPIVTGASPAVTQRGVFIPACPEVSALTTPHVGDTEQFIALSRTMPPRRPRWSGPRRIALASVLAAVACYTLAVVGQKGKRVVELPESGIDLLRVLLLVAILVFVGACAYDVVGSRIWRALAAIRIGNRALAARLGQAEAALAAAAEREKRMEATLSRVDERGSDIESLLVSLTGAIPTYGADRREEGYEAALRGIRDNNRITVSMPLSQMPPPVANGHLRLV